MPVWEKRSVYPVPAEELFAWHTRPLAVQRMIPPWEEAEIEECSGGIQVGARVVLRLRVGLVPVRWVAHHDRYEENRRFRDIQVRGPFARWEHDHLFEVAPGGSALTDRIRYDLPFGPLGNAFGGSFVRRKLERSFRYRHALLGFDLKRHARYWGQAPLRFIVRGAPPPIQTAIEAFLSTGGRHLVASTAEADCVVQFTDTPGTGGTLRELSSLPSVDYPFGTLVVVETPGGDPAVAGERDVLLKNADRAGVRTVLLRTGHVLTPAADPLQSLLRAPWARHRLAETQLGRLSWISIEDLLGLLLTAASSPAVSGSIEASAPERLSPAVFRETLRRVVRRSPAEPVSALSNPGSGASDAAPTLEPPGFRYLLPDLEGALRFLLGR